MSEEEEEAIWYMGEILIDINDIEQWNVIKNLIEKQQAEIKKFKMQLQDIHDNFCKFNWEESNPKQVHNQLKELYESIYRKVEKDES